MPSRPPAAGQPLFLLLYAIETECATAVPPEGGKRLKKDSGCGNIIKYMKKYMEAALAEARRAMDMGEVPVGAVVVRDGEILGRGHNLTEFAKDPTAHAEMIAVREAAAALGGWRLTGCSLYVTVEPCAMCAGALVWSRIERLVIGTMDPKGGACGSVLNVADNPRLNHRIRVEAGLMQAECEALMKDFFRELRIQKRE